MEKQIKIYFSEDSDLTELEMSQKGWRGDIVVEYENQTYEVQFITLERLTGEYKYSIQKGEVYFIEPTTIIVESTDKKTIIEAIINLCQSNLYLGNGIMDLQKVDLKEKFRTAFEELQDLKNWVRVY